MKNWGKAAFGILFFLAVSALPFNTEAAGRAGKTLSLNQAKSLALSNSQEYTTVRNKLELAKIQYTQSVKAIQLKKKNQSTFRWTPLLNFKFPEKPDLSDEFEYTYKPLELQSKIDSLNHEKSDCVFGVYEKVSFRFESVYVLQVTLKYEQEKEEALRKTLSQNRARLLLGAANPQDIDGMEKKLKKLEESQAAHMRSLEAGREKLSELTGLDVSTDYTFLNPHVKAEIGRENLDALIRYTLENDHAFYMTRMETSNGLLALNTNYNLMKNQYGSNMGYIDSYINQARRGEKLDSAAFRLKYDQLLEAVDRPWQGKKKILFIRIPKVWFKGAIDGVRYVEDEPYVLYEAALEYQNQYVEEQNMKKELTSQVKDAWENYITARNAWESVEKDLKEKEKELKKAGLLNSIGELTYEEYAGIQEEYEELMQQRLDALSAYSQILYSLDRLTCGAVSRLMTGADTDLETAAGGESYIVAEEENGAYYYIHSLVQDNLFELGISVPDDFEPAVTDFELWINGRQVGERTPASRPVRHLKLSIDHVERAFLRLYEDGEFIDDCDIDVTAWSGKLPIISGYRVEREEETLVGSYSSYTDSVTGLLELTIKPEASQPIASYNIKAADGSFLLSEEAIPVNTPFCYLPAAKVSLSELTICLYGKDGSLLYEGGFRTADGTIHKKTETG